MTLKTLDLRTRGQWRAWLGRHHESSPGVWLVFHKRATGRKSIEYADALDEALCFGWIDSLLKRLDDRRYARKFTPRRPDSIWSDANRIRYARLKASGRLTRAGLCRAPTGRTYGPPGRPLGEVPGYIRDVLKRNPKAFEYFERLAPSYRRAYIGWIDSAKRQETKARRLLEAAGRLAAGRKLGIE